MSIRKLDIEELEIVNKIAHQTWPHTFQDILSSEQIKFMLNWMYNLDTLRNQANNGHHFYVFEDNGIALGFIGIEPNHPSKDSAKIHKIYILPTAQGLGIGKELILKAIDFAKEHNLERLVLNVNRFNQAVDFYQHIGFEITKEEDIEIGGGYLMEDFVMELKL